MPELRVITSYSIHYTKLYDAYRTYPHVDMADTGARAAHLLERMLKSGERLARADHGIDFLTGLPSQCSFIEPCKGIYTELGEIVITSYSIHYTKLYDTAPISMIV